MTDDTIDNVINDANEIALSWYSILSGNPLPSQPPPVIPQGAVTAGAYQSPTTAMIVSQVTQPWVVLGIAVLVVGLVYLTQK